MQDKEFVCKNCGYIIEIKESETSNIGENYIKCRACGTEYRYQTELQYKTVITSGPTIVDDSFKSYSWSTDSKDFDTYGKFKEKT